MISSFLFLYAGSASWVCSPHSCTGLAFRRALCLVWCPAVTFLKFFIFEQEILHVYLSLSSTSYVASFACSLVLKDGKAGTLPKYSHFLFITRWLLFDFCSAFLLLFLPYREEIYTMYRWDRLGWGHFSLLAMWPQPSNFISLSLV